VSFDEKTFRLGGAFVETRGLFTATDRLSETGIGTGGRGSVWAKPVSEDMLHLIPENLRGRWLTAQELDEIHHQALVARQQAKLQ
jgi:hypothetical protein